VYSKRAIYIIAVILLAEAITVIVVPSRLPVPVRFLAAAINIVAVAVLWLLARQRPS
jgi:hypothetical protein